SLLEELAKEYELNYDPSKSKEVQFLRSFLFFKTKKVSHLYNRLSDEKHITSIFDVEFSEGEFIAKEVVRTTMMHIELDQNMPEFTLDREGLLERFYALAGFKDIPVLDHPDFSSRFYLLGEDEEAIRAFFTTDLIHFFESNPYYHVESNGDSLVIFGRERLASIKELKALLDFGNRLKDVVQNIGKNQSDF
ncbi:MAG: SulP family inorganic anion transporter, partial [Bacteroidia bacterium]|nr:SulP family inorganic anion transporter [Bacteroidia bacterium]